MLCIFLSSVSLQAAAQDNWPQFRGPGARGISTSPNLPDRWSATENVAWKTDVPGRGWSSPIAWGDRIFLTTVVNTADTEPPKKGLYFGGERPVPASQHRWIVLCLDLKTGAKVWQRTVHQGTPDTSIHVKNSYASETPVTDGRHVYALFGNVGLYCLTMDGKPVWEHRLEPRRTRLGWGTAASPVLHKGRLYLVNDNEEQSYLLALSADTGRELWRVPRGEKSNWATPYVWETPGRTEIVTAGSGQVRSYDTEGRLLWTLKGMSSITIATPYSVGGLLILSSGYVGDRSKPIYAVRPGATGDISLKPGERSSSHIAWCAENAAPYNPTTLAVANRIFVLYDFGFLGIYRTDTGQVLLERERIPNGRGFTASPWSYGGKIFCLNEDGVTFVFRESDRMELLHQNPLAEDDMCMATPAIVGDRLIIRTSARVYCIRPMRS
jgi:outer membrane protein assembly factor BamB